MGAPILTEDAIQEAFRKYCTGIMLKDLAGHYGVSPTALGSAFARRGLKRGGAFQSPGIKQLAMIARKTADS